MNDPLTTEIRRVVTVVADRAPAAPPADALRRAVPHSSDPRRSVALRVVAVASVGGVLLTGWWLVRSAPDQIRTLESPPDSVGVDPTLTTDPSLTTDPTLATDPSPGSPVVPTITDTLGVDSSGPAVAALQQRLVDLRFDPGPVDGYYGASTQAAVWAYEKLVLRRGPSEVTGQVTPAEWSAMQVDPTIAPLRPGATRVHVEVYLPSQVAVVFEANEPLLITHISSGDGTAWSELVSVDPGTSANPGTEPVSTLVSGTGVTPSGTFTVAAAYTAGDGWRTGALGRMFHPISFAGDDMAIHGAADVPARPASHGTIRVPMHVAEYLPELLSAGDEIIVADATEPSRVPTPAPTTAP